MMSWPRALENTATIKNQQAAKRNNAYIRLQTPSQVTRARFYSLPDAVASRYRALPSAKLNSASAFDTNGLNDDHRSDSARKVHHAATYNDALASAGFNGPAER